MQIKKIVNNKKIRKVLLKLFDLLSALNQIIPKNKNKILFYDSFNTEIEDNSKALLEYMIEKGYNKKYKIICGIPQNPKFDKYKEQGIKTVGAIGSVFCYFNAKYFFTSFGNIRIAPSKDQSVINLWHGTPLKTIGHMGGDHKNEKIDYFTYTLATSEFVKPIMAKSFGCDESKILIMGHPRNDYLFYDSYVLNKLIDTSVYSKKIIWMPTFRVSKDNFYSEGNCGNTETMLPVLYSMKEYEKLNSFLLDNKILIVIKIHNYSSELKIKNMSNIKIVSNRDLNEKNIPLYEFIKDFDALITDYSSVFFDFLLLNRPIGFTIDDYEEYKASRGFSFENAIKYMPGKKISKYSEFVDYIKDVANEFDEYSLTRNQINDLFNTYQDGENRKRILKYLEVN